MHYRVRQSAYVTTAFITTFGAHTVITGQDQMKVVPVSTLRTLNLPVQSNARIPRYHRHNPSINATHDKPSWQTVQRRSTLTLRPSIREIPGSIPGRYTAWTGCFALYFSPSKTLAAVVPRAGHDRFLRNAYRSTSVVTILLLCPFTSRLHMLAFQLGVNPGGFPALSGGTYMLDKQFGY